MQTQALGKSSLVSTRLSYGCMRIVHTWTPSDVTEERAKAGRQSVIAAYEAGYTLFDHADIYCRGMCETVFGQALREVPGMRNRILIATKCGIRFPGEPRADSPHRYDFSADHILWSCEQSLKRLGVEMIDLYQLHRPDVLMNPPEIARAFDQLKSQGKVREFGVSNFSPSQVAALQKHLPPPLLPLAVNQVEIHPLRLDCFFDGTLDQCIAETITPLSWSPLAGGIVADGGTIDPKHPNHAPLSNLLNVLDETAAKYDVGRTVISLAWLLKHPAKIIPIIGATKPENIRQATRADAVDLSREDWYRILVAARMKPLP
ncbi:MAG TPA: aldo/keto reductase [Tepidisphaeraceae bacterium]|jgi:predicted oxidoreductase